MHPADAIKAMYDEGQRIFGENRVQELVEKQALLPEDIEWHLIGHLQKNKVKYIAPFISLIHSVDSLDLLLEVEKQAQRHDRKIPILLQIKIAEEESKFGIDPDDLISFMEGYMKHEALSVPIIGVMGMASFVDDKNQIRREFQILKKCFDSLQAKYFEADQDFKEISMGMSGDFPIALEEGSTMVRVGSLLFGKR
ncbi:UNVERIFIED_CONTAM: hypothetical protein GTU68_028326 [Idotea baltica]|nr:hypothetical protein [Idotea baltica]